MPKSRVPAIVTLMRRWAAAPHDYVWIVEHHSMRPLNVPIRLVLAGNTLLIAVCSLLLLRSPQGPSGPVGVGVAVSILVVQAVAIVTTFVVPIPTSDGQARRYFVGFGIFGDVGLAAVVVQYSPLVNAFGCALFVLNGALYTFFVSARWVLAHLAFSAGVILYATWRVHESGAFDSYATAAGALVLLASVCGVPVAAHVAWNLLSVDARQSLLDPLTGLRNRRGVEVSLEPLWRRACGTSTSVAAVVVDIDGFKQVNDTHGHDSGDTVLRTLSSRMRAIVGPDAVVARTGGEEFTLVLLGAPDDVVERVATLPQRLHAPEDPVPVTVSVGVAVVTAPSLLTFDATVEQALRTADAHMYEAKRAGGDQVSVAVL